MLSPRDLQTIKEASKRNHFDKLNLKIFEIKPTDLVPISRSGKMVYECLINHGLDNDQLLCRITQLSEKKTKVSLHFEDTNNIKVSCVDKVHLMLSITPDTYIDLRGAVTEGVPGPKGDKGDVGPQGPKGDRGPQGEPGIVRDLIDDSASKTSADKTYSAKQIHALLATQAKKFESKMRDLVGAKSE